MVMLPLLLVVSLAAPPAFTQTVVVPPKPAPMVVRKTVPPVPKEVPVVITAEKGMVHLKAPNGDIQAKRIEIVPEPAVSGGVAQLLDEQLALERQRLQLDKAQVENDAALELQRLELEVERSRMQVDYARMTEKAGGADANVVISRETELKLNIARLASARRSVDLRLEDLVLREQELVLKHRMQKAGVTGPVVESVQVVTPLHKRLVGSEAVRPGDIVTIVIEGRVGGVRDFMVDAAGTIRHPQLGDIIVADHSIAGVREKVIKLLLANGLSKDPTVSVTVYRR